MRHSSFGDDIFQSGQYNSRPLFFAPIDLGGCWNKLRYLLLQESADSAT